MDFSDFIVACYIKVDICKQLNELLQIQMYQSYVIYWPLSWLPKIEYY